MSQEHFQPSISPTTTTTTGAQTRSLQSELVKPQIIENLCNGGSAARTTSMQQTTEIEIIIRSNTEAWQSLSDMQFSKKHILNMLVCENNPITVKTLTVFCTERNISMIRTLRENVNLTSEAISQMFTASGDSIIQKLEEINDIYPFLKEIKELLRSEENFSNLFMEIKVDSIKDVPKYINNFADIIKGNLQDYPHNRDEILKYIITQINKGPSPAQDVSSLGSVATFEQVTSSPSKRKAKKYEVNWEDEQQQTGAPDRSSKLLKRAPLKESSNTTGKYNGEAQHISSTTGDFSRQAEGGFKKNNYMSNLQKDLCLPESMWMIWMGKKKVDIRDLNNEHNDHITKITDELEGNNRAWAQLESLGFKNSNIRNILLNILQRCTGQTIKEFCSDKSISILRDLINELHFNAQQVTCMLKGSGSLVFNMINALGSIKSSLKDFIDIGVVQNDIVAIIVQLSPEDISKFSKLDSNKEKIAKDLSGAGKCRAIALIQEILKSDEEYIYNSITTNETETKVLSYVNKASLHPQTSVDKTDRSAKYHSKAVQNKDKYAVEELLQREQLSEFQMQQQQLREKVTSLQQLHAPQQLQQQLYAHPLYLPQFQVQQPCMQPLYLQQLQAQQQLQQQFYMQQLQAQQQFYMQQLQAQQQLVQPSLYQLQQNLRQQQYAEIYKAPALEEWFLMQQMPGQREDAVQRDNIQQQPENDSDDVKTGNLRIDNRIIPITEFSPKSEKGSGDKTDHEKDESVSSHPESEPIGVFVEKVAANEVETREDEDNSDDLWERELIIADHNPFIEDHNPLIGNQYPFSPAE